MNSCSSMLQSRSSVVGPLSCFSSILSSISLLAPFETAGHYLPNHFNTTTSNSTTGYTSGDQNNTPEEASRSNDPADMRVNNSSKPTNTSFTLSTTSLPTSARPTQSAPVETSQAVLQPNEKNSAVPTTHQAPKPSSTSHQAPKPSSTSHQTPKPSSTSHQTPKPSSTSHQTPKPSSTSHQTPKPSSTSHQTPKPSSTSHQTTKPTVRTTPSLPSTTSTVKASTTVLPIPHKTSPTPVVPTSQLSSRKSTLSPTSLSTEAPALPPSRTSVPGSSRKPSASATRVAVVEVAGAASTRQSVDTASLSAVSSFGSLFFSVTVAVFVTQAYESYRRKDYTQVDYSINGMYSDSGV